MKQLLVVLLLVLFLIIPTNAQTFRGAINGTVTDPSGAVVPGAHVKATNKATSIDYTSESTADGNFVFQDLPVGTYKVTVIAGGFPTLEVDGILVAQGAIYTLNAGMKMSQQSTTVEVSAAALTLDTTTSTQSTLVEGANLQTMPLNGRDFTQLISVTPGFGGYSAGGYGSLNGTRANQINWQIDGVDNNDLWHNIPAVNQGGVSGIAGIVLPIDAVDQFSVQTQAAPESGRNPGGTVDLALKSGGNSIHGSAYAYFRNEAFAAASPFVSEKKENRNYNYGFSVGAPILKDRLFFFTTFEKQRFTIGLPGLATEPSADYQTEAQALLTAYSVPGNSVTSALLTNLWPSYALTGPAIPNNYSSPDPEYGYSYNGLVKIDYKINDKNTLSFHYFAGQGNQVAPVGGSALSEAASELKYYYEVAPIHVSNYALVWNSTISPSWSNQTLAGVNYFHQKFSDFNNGFDVATYGLNLSPNFDATGLTGAPNIGISGFDGVGQTPPEGREDITGHLTDVVSHTFGKHQLRFGGEFRKAQLEEFYHRHALGSFTFDGTQGPWYADYQACTGYFATVAGCVPGGNGSYDYNILTLADFLAGDVSRSSIALGDPTRLVYVKTFNLFVQDSWQISRRLTLNYGVRWDYEGPVGDDKKDLSVFVPSKGGLVFQGAGIDSVYPKQYKNFSPRIGFAFQPKGNGDLVVRAGFGVYFDTPNLNPFLDNRPANGAPNGLEGNPAGPSPVETIPANNYTIVADQAIFQPGGACPTGSGCSQVYNIFSVNQKFRNAYNYNYNLNIEKALGKSLLLQVGYVGSAAHRLLTTQDINQPALNSSGVVDQTTRPYYAQFPDFGYINEIQADGNSNYNSLQAVLKIREWHRFTSQVTYTWAHALDDMTAYRGTLPQDSNFLQGDYGNSDFDTRHNFTALLNYDVPGASRLKLLANGWALSSLLSFHTGPPFTVFSSSDTTGTGEGVQRADQIGDPFAGVSHAFSSGGVTWVNPAAFTNPAPGTFGTSPRNGYYGPGFASVDFSIVKNTKITERINTQFRIEMYNLFNRINLAAPSSGLGGGFGVSSDTIGDYNGAPGIGPGEPFNMQLALKIIF
jgi:hypothetical protein